MRLWLLPTQTTPTPPMTVGVETGPIVVAVQRGAHDDPPHPEPLKAYSWPSLEPTKTTPLRTAGAEGPATLAVQRGVHELPPHPAALKAYNLPLSEPI